jgi:uncharacterized membrane protein
LTDLSGGITPIDSSTDVSLGGISELNTKTVSLKVVIGILFVIILAIVIVFMLMYSNKVKSLKKRIMHETGHRVSTESVGKSEQPVDEHEHKILQIIKKEKRMTQKDLRKEIPLSEAKISLVISDLESKGKIRKIKKGRGNILIFVKD